MEQLSRFVSYAFLIPSAMIFVICIYYLSRKMTPQGILILIGSFIGLLSSLFHRVGITYFASQGMLIEDMKEILILTGAGSLVGSFLFAIGFILLVIEASRSREVKGRF